jgi:hypothetical protein
MPSMNQSTRFSPAPIAATTPVMSYWGCTNSWR